MDLNELLFQHQRAILHADRGTPEAVGFDLVGHYAHRIRRLRERLGVVAYPEWMALLPEAI
jgi:hypothetical protein